MGCLRHSVKGMPRAPRNFNPRPCCNVIHEQSSKLLFTVFCERLTGDQSRDKFRGLNFDVPRLKVSQWGDFVPVILGQLLKLTLDIIRIGHVIWI